MDTVLNKAAKMMKAYSMVSANFQPKEPIKLYLPTHEMWWKIPYERKKTLTDEVDEILKSIQKAQAVAKRKKVYLTSIASYGIGMPSPGGWVLVDSKDGSLVHPTYMESLVYPGGEYTVLCMGATEIPMGILRSLNIREGRHGEGEDEDENFEEVGENIDRVA